MEDNLKDYYCDGICEKCEMGKHYGKSGSGYFTCNEEKIKGLNIIAPSPPDLLFYKKGKHNAKI